MLVSAYYCPYMKSEHRGTFNELVYDRTEARSFGSLDVIPVSKKFHPSFTLKKFEVRLKRGRRNTKGILICFNKFYVNLKNIF